MESTEGSAATPDKQPWIYVAIGVILLALAVGAWFLFRDEAGGSRGQDERSRGFGIKQASWNIHVRAVAGPALPDKKRGVSKKETKRLQRLIKSVYNAAYLRPDLMDKVVRKYIAPKAASAIRKRGPQIPNAARKIKTHKRTAIVGVDPRGSSRAAARVHVVASGENGGKKFKTISSDRLWLERSQGKWRVIAYDVSRKPLPLKPNGEKGKDDKESNAKKDEGKKDERKKDRKGSKK